MLFAPIRWALRIAGLVLAVVVLYFAVTLVQVWLTSRQYEPHAAGAVLVMGAAQYNGVPSPDLASRLDEALLLYHQGYSHLIMVTGNKERGDVYTEAESGEMYLVSKGVPRADILEAGGRRQLRERGRRGTRTQGAPCDRGARDNGPLPRGPLDGHRHGSGTDAVADTDPDVTD